MSESERYRKRFGEIAIELGFVDERQVDEALGIQRDRKKAGKSSQQLGQILLQLGYISLSQIEVVVDQLFPPSADTPRPSSNPE